MFVKVFGTVVISSWAVHSVIKVRESEDYIIVKLHSLCILFIYDTIYLLHV